MRDPIRSPAGCEEYVLSISAGEDLDEIWDYIAEDSISAADRWIAKLFQAFQSIAQTPGMGHKREDLTSFPIPFWLVGAYLIIYRSQNDLIETIATTQGAPDIPVFFHQRTL